MFFLYFLYHTLPWTKRPCHELDFGRSKLDGGMEGGSMGFQFPVLLLNCNKQSHLNMMKLYVCEFKFWGTLRSPSRLTMTKPHQATATECCSECETLIFDAIVDRKINTVDMEKKYVKRKHSERWQMTKLNRNSYVQKRQTNPWTFKCKYVETLLQTNKSSL